MRTIKKIGVWMLVICMFMAQVVSAHAAEEYTNPTLIVSDAAAEAGTQVHVTIEMVNNPGIINMALNVDYDDTVLSLVSTDLDGDYCPDGVVDGGILGSYLHSNNANLDDYYLYWANDTARKNYTTDGLLVTLVFDVAANAAAGEYPIEIFYGDFEIFNFDFKPVNFDIVNGTVTVNSKICKHTDKVEVPSQNPNCEIAGNYQYFVCDDCDMAFKADGVTETTVEAETIAKLGHDYQNGVCANCGDKDPSDVKPDKPANPGWSTTIKNWFGKWWGKEESCDHVYETVVTDPTCTEKGYTTHICSKCGDSYKDSYVKAVGHDYKDNVCLDCGYKKIQKPFFGFLFDWLWKK